MPSWPAWPSSSRVAGAARRRPPRLVGVRQLPPSAAGGAGREVLLDAQQLTVLDQAVAYPKKTPAQVTERRSPSSSPGQETGWHKHKVPLFVYVLEGTVTVEYDAGVTKEFPAGTAYLEAQDVWHNVHQQGRRPRARS